VAATGVLVTPPDEAVIDVAPSASEVTTPALVTDATAASLEFHVNVTLDIGLPF
jgi:hypothetical protein